jgi:hypothetical protein
MKLRRRAEAGGDDVLLVQTFVDVGPLLTLLTGGTAALAGVPGG